MGPPGSMAQVRVQARVSHLAPQRLKGGSREIPFNEDTSNKRVRLWIAEQENSFPKLTRQIDT
eukprot:6306282-Amphidinium_carterae.1